MYTHTRIYTFTHMHTLTHTLTHTSIYLFTSIYAHKGQCSDFPTPLSLIIHTYTYTYINVYTYICIFVVYIHIHVCIKYIHDSTIATSPDIPNSRTTCRRGCYPVWARLEQGVWHHGFALDPTLGVACVGLC